MQSFLQHKVNVTGSDGPVVFRWYWPKGTFSRRMSAKEIAIFLLPHLPSVIPHLAFSPVAVAHLEAMFFRLITWPDNKIDAPCSWIRPVLGTCDNDIIRLELNCLTPPHNGPVYSIPKG